MKRALIVVLAMAALLVSVRAAADVEVKDMHKGHWAYDSVQMLLQKGYLALYDDGTFRGNLPVSREVFATALAKLIDQINNGEIGMSGADMSQIKKISDAFKDEISNYESRVKSLEQKIAELEDINVVFQKDINSTVVEMRDGFEAMQDENSRMRQEVSMLNEEVKSLNADLSKERKDRKSSQTIMWIGIIAAIAVGAAGD